jgi:hypothetical protein
LFTADNCIAGKDVETIGPYTKIYPEGLRKIKKSSEKLAQVA